MTTETVWKDGVPEQKRRLIIDFTVGADGDPFSMVGNHHVAQWLKENMPTCYGVSDVDAVWEQQTGMTVDTFNGEWRWL